VNPLNTDERTAGEVYMNDGATRPLSVDQLREQIASQHAFRIRMLARNKARWS
jgi:hypothetical protein